jgi:hypothetical protein
VVVLTGAAAVAAFYAFLLDVRKRTYIRQLIAQIKERDGAKWQALPRLHRAMPRVGLSVVFKAGIIGDTETLGLYAGLRRIERRQMGALIVCAAAIVLLLIGAQSWGWRW